MVARSRINAKRPTVDVNMLDLDLLLGNGRGDEHVVELLLKVVKYVSVFFFVGQPRKIIDLRDETVECGERRTGLHKLVEVATDDDASSRVHAEERLYEGLFYGVKCH